MPGLRHLQLKEYPYMVTTVTVNREKIFEDTVLADIVLDALFFGRKMRWYYLLSFVIMPEHLHLIIIPDGKNISDAIKSVKGFTARQINAEHNRRGSIWQSGYYDYVLDSEEKVFNRIRYVEENPVRKGMVLQAEDYKFSSINHREETDFEMFV